MGKNVDQVDLKIIRLLQKDGRMSNTEIAKIVTVTEGTVRKRLNRLVKEKIIQVVAVGNISDLTFGISCNMRLKTDPQNTQEIIETLRAMDEVWYLTRIAGGSENINAEFIVQSFEDYNKFMDRIYKIDGVISLNQVFYTEEIKETYIWGPASGPDNS